MPPKYSLVASMLMCRANFEAIALDQHQVPVAGRLDRLDWMVESMDTRAHLAASFRLLLRLNTRSMMGLPYFDSPT